METPFLCPILRVRIPRRSHTVLIVANGTQIFLDAQGEPGYFRVRGRDREQM